ncbi:MAG: ABC transporter permease [Chloroflexota bacterium]
MRRLLPAAPRALLLLGTVAFVFVPMAILAIYSVAQDWNYPRLLPASLTGRWFRYIFQSEGAGSAIEQSVEVAVVVTLLGLLIGVPAGYALARYRFPGRKLVELLFLAKTTVPVILLGVGTASLFLTWHLFDTFQGIVLAHLVGALPFQVWTATAAFERLDIRQEEAARDLGASFLRRFAQVSVPGARGGIIAGSILVFLFSMDEFTVTFLISGIHWTTMPLRLYSAIQQNYIEPGAAAAIVLLTPSLVYLVVVAKFFGSDELRRGIANIG